MVELQILLIEINIISGALLIRFELLSVSSLLADQLENDHQGGTLVAVEDE